MSTQYDQSGVAYDSTSVEYDGGTSGGGHDQAVSGSVAPSGSLRKHALGHLSGVLSSGAVVIRGAKKLVVVGVAVAGSLLQSAQRIVTGTQSLDGDLVVSSSKSISGSLDLESSVRRAVDYHVSTQLGTSGSLSAEKETGTPTQVTSGALASSGSLRKSVVRHLSGTLSASGSTVFPVQRRGGLSGYAGPIIRVTLTRDPAREASELLGFVRPSGHLVVTTQYGTPRHMRHWEMNKRVLLAEMDEDVAELV